MIDIHFLNISTLSRFFLFVVVKYSYYASIRKEIRMDIWIPVLVAVVTGLLSYFASSMKSNKDVQKLKIDNDAQLQRLREQHQAELQKIEVEHTASLERMRTEFEIKIASYSSEKESDVKYAILESFLKQAISDPDSASKGFQGLMNLAKVAEQYKTDKK